jgi:hypothetical protein
MKTARRATANFMVYPTNMNLENKKICVMEVLCT